MKLPEKARAGEKLSARWLNQVIDCLKELAKAANMAGNGSSTSSIEYSGSDMHDTKYRGTVGAELQEFRVAPFQLRLKPKRLCSVSSDGEWEKVVQMKAGVVLDYMGKTHPAPEDTAIHDFTEGWVDIGPFSEQLQKIYCVIKQDCKGEITKIEIKKDEEAFIPWGKTAENEKGDGVLSVFIGSCQLLKIEGVNRAHIYQAHCGTLDLQTVQVEKLMDAEDESQSGSDGESSGDAGESGEFESKPAGLFRKRDGHLFIFKKLICGEGLRLEEANNLKIKLRRANSVWSGGIGSAESSGSDEPVISLGGVEDIVFDKDITMPELASGIIKIPYADTIKGTTGVISGLAVNYAPATLGEDGSISFLPGNESLQNDAPSEGSSGSANDHHNQIVDGVIYVTIPILQEEASLSMSESASESASASASGSSSEDGSGSSDLSASGSASASGSSPGSASSEEASSDKGSAPGSSSGGGGGSSGGGSSSGDGSGSESFGSSSGCDCAEKWSGMETRIAELEQRIAELEKKECNCQCGDLLAQIQAAVASEAQAIAASINYEVSVNGVVVTTTEYGTIYADTTGSVTANGGSASSNIHY